MAFHVIKNLEDDSYLARFESPNKPIFEKIEPESKNMQVAIFPDEDAAKQVMTVLDNLHHFVRIVEFSEITRVDIEVWHAKEPKFNTVTERPKDLNIDYNHVATLQALVLAVEVTGRDTVSLVACEQIFMQTQNLDKAWQANTRSTSVGDIFVVMDNRTNVGVEVYGVDKFGFNKLL